MSKTSEKTVKSKRKKKKVLFLVFFILITFGLLFSLSLTVFFPVKNVIIQGESVYTHEEIITASGINENNNLFLVKEAQVLLSIQQKLPFIKEIELKRKFPDKVIIKVKDVDTYLLFERNETVICTDDGLRIVPNEISESAFKMKVYCSWQKNDSSSKITLENEDDFEIIEQVVSSAKNSGITVNVLDLQNKQEIRMLVDNRFEVVLGDYYDFSGKFSKLIAMMKNIEPEKTGRIDLSDWTQDNTNTYFVETDISIE